MRKQCVPGSFLSAHALEPGNEARGSLKRGLGAFNKFGYFSRGSLKRGVAAFQESLDISLSKERLQ